MFSDKTTDGLYNNKKHLLDNSFNIKLNNKSNSKELVENINKVVDSLIAKKNPTIAKKRKLEFVSNNFTDSVLGMSDLISMKKLFAIFLSFVLLFAVITSANSLVESDLSAISTDDQDESQDELLSLNKTSGEQKNISKQNGPVDQINNATNQNSSYDLIDDENKTIDNSKSFTGLDLSLNSNKEIFLINESINIYGLIDYNNSKIDTSLNLLVNGPDLTFQTEFNSINGAFNYFFNLAKTGSYTIQVSCSYLNETILREISIIVYNETEPKGTINSSEISVWDDTDSEIRYSDSEITFYANYSSKNSIIPNASCLISFDLGGWTKPVQMKYSNGIYSFTRYFDVIGSNKYKVICSKPGYELQTKNKEFFLHKPQTIEPEIKSTNLIIWDDADKEISFIDEEITFYANYHSNGQTIKNAECMISFNINGWTQSEEMDFINGKYTYSRSFDRSGRFRYKIECSLDGYEERFKEDFFTISDIPDTASIVDPKQDNVYILPGTSFYVERTIYGPHGTDVTFAPLFSSDLTLEKIEIIDRGESNGEITQSLSKEINNAKKPDIFSLGQPRSNLEKNIDKISNQISHNIEGLDKVSYTEPINLQKPIKIRIWYKAPSWEDIQSGKKASQGKISYMTLSPLKSDLFDFEGSTWWNSGWGYRKLITINSSQVVSDLANFPLLVYKASDSDLASRAQSDGDDIAFVLYSDNTTQLNHEIETFNSSNGQLIAWVNVTSVSSTTDTKLWMYYNNLACSNQENPTDVWSDYTLVYHLNEDYIDLVTEIMGVTSMGAMDGSDGGWAVFLYDNPDQEGVTFACDEDDFGDAEREHTTEQFDYWFFNTSQAGDILNETGGVIGEYGRASNVGSTWQSINFRNSYTNPTIVCTYKITSESNEPAVVRISNITGTDCDVKLQIASAAGSPTADDVSYIVMEQGNHTLTGGVSCEAGEAYPSGVNDGEGSADWSVNHCDQISYINSYTNPRVLHQIVTENDTDWSASWSNDGAAANPPDSGGCRIGMHVAGDTDTTRTLETVGYIVIEDGTGTTNGTDWVADRTADVIDGVDNQGYLSSLGFYPGDTTRYIQDSTSNSYDADPYEPDAVKFEETGKIGRAAKSYGTENDADFAQIRDKMYAIADTVSELMVQCWFKCNVSSAATSIIDFDRSEKWSAGIYYYSSGNTIDKLSWDTNHGGSVDDLSGNADVTDDAWRLAHFTWNWSGSSGAKRIYLNGSVDASTTVGTSNLGGAGSDNENRYGFLFTGSEEDSFPVSDPSTETNYNAEHLWLDELRVREEMPENYSDWIETEYNNQNNLTTFLTFSGENEAFPMLSNPVPSDGSTNIAIPPTMFNITIQDPNGDNMNITWRTNASGSWTTFNTTDGGGTGIGNGTYSVTNTSWVTNSGTVYWWSANVSDGDNWNNETYSFTSSYEPQLSDEEPANRTSSIDSPICRITVTDPDGGTVTVRFYENSSGPWELQQTNNSIDVTSPVIVEWDNYANATVFGETYWWKVNVTDGKGNFVEGLYWFTTTTDDPPILSFETPGDGSKGERTNLLTLNVTIEDPDGHNMNWTIETSPNVGSDSANGVGNGSISCSISGLLPSNTYYWYVNVTDGILWTNESYIFTTNANPTQSGETPINESVNICPIPSLYVVCSDFDGDTMNATWWSNWSGNWVQFDSTNNIVNNTNISTTCNNFSSPGETYWWSVNLSDGEIGWNNETYNFTTNYNPTLSGEAPTNFSENIQTNPTLYVFCEDLDNDSMTAYWFSNSTGPWIQFAYNSSFYNGTNISQTNANFSSTKTLYWWSVNLTDGCNWTNETYRFYTLNGNPSQNGESPTNQSTDLSPQPTLNVVCIDFDTIDVMNVTWYSNSSSSWVKFGQNNSVSNNTNISQTNSNFSGYGVTYYWRVVISDGSGGISNETYQFRTIDLNTNIDSISPYEIASDTVNISASDNGVTPDNITLYYRYSDTNNSWCRYETGIQSDVNSWTKVNLTNNYTNPIVIASGQEGWDNGDENEVTSRPIIRNVNGSDFEVRVLDDEGNNVVTDVGYLVIEEGHWEIDGVEVEAGTYTRSSTASTTVTFQEAFPDNNVVIVDSCQNDSGAYPLTSRYTETTRSSTGYTVYHEYFDVDGSFPGSQMTIGYLAIQEGNPSSIFEGDVEIEVNQDFGNEGAIGAGEWVAISFSNTYSSTPILFVNPVDEDGGDPVVAGVYDLTNSGFDISLAEGDNEDVEQSHNDADCPWIVWTSQTSNGTGWTEYSEDSASPWNWDFDFNEGTGYYEFYSIGKMAGSGDEPAPSTSDARCYYEPPSLPTITTNSATGVEETNATLNALLSDNGSAETTCGFRYGTSSGSYGTNITYGIVANSTDYANDTIALNTGQIYYFQAWANNSIGFSNGSELTFLTKPNVTTNLVATTYNETQINLTWNVGDGANTTYIEYNTSSSSWARGSGNLLYNGSGVSYEHTELSQGVNYYYQAWSYSNWTYDSTTLYQWSDDNDSASNSTNEIPTIALIAPSPNGTTNTSSSPVCQIWANDTDGDTLTVDWYENSSGSYAWSQTNSSISANSTVSWIYSNALLGNNSYYWKVTVNDSITNTTKWFYFTTELNETINITPSSWNIGSTTIGESNASTGLYFNLSNDGNVALDIQVKAGNATNSTTGAEWILNSTADFDKFTLGYNMSGGAIWTQINLTYDTFVTNLASSSWQTFDLNLTMATTSSKSDPLELTITFRSVVS